MYLSPATRAALESELDHIIRVAIPTQEADIEDTRHENRDENVGFWQAGAEATRLNKRADHIRAALNASADATPPSGQTVEPGVTVELKFAGETATEVFCFGSPEEAATHSEVITPESPVGQAIAGARAGSSVPFAGGVEIVAVAAV